MAKDGGPMKLAVKRTEGIRWDRWHRTVVMRSLELMVMNGVVRHAEVDPPQHFDDHAVIEEDPEASVSSMPPVIVDEESWFTRFSCRQADSPFMQARHTT
jgi:hypothetical protein